MEELERTPGSVLRYQLDAEQILGVPLLPEHVPFPDEEGSIREIAYSAVLRMLATQRHRDRRAASQDEAYSAERWNSRWNVSAVTKQKITNEHTADIALLATHVSVANDVMARSRTIAFNAEQNAERALFQTNIAKAMWRYAEYPGKNVLESDDTTLEGRIKGGSLAVISPTGSGKTYLEAAYLSASGIGEPLYEGSKERRRALVVVSSQALLRQYLGELGDDTFRKVLGPKATVGAIWQKSTEDDSDVTVVIDQSLPRLIDEGRIDLTQFQVTVVDEAHNVFRPMLFKRLGELGTKLLFFTATPAYDEFRDLRNYFANVSEGRLRDFVERGILNPVCLRTYRPERGKQAALAVYLGVQAVRAGFKIVVYGRPSPLDADETEIEYIARRMNEELGRDDENPAAQVLSKRKGRSPGAVLERFSNGDTRAVVTVRMIKEGHNDPNIDGVILIGPNRSKVDVPQKIGRCMRASNTMSFVLEVLQSGGVRGSHYSIWEAFDLHEVNDARVISLRGTPLFDWPHMRNFAPPEELGVVVDDRPVREISLPEKSLRQQEFIEAGASQLSDLSDTYQVPWRWLQQIFDENNIPHTIISQQCQQGKTFVTWYAGEADVYLRQHPELLERVFSAELAAATLGIPARMLRTTRLELGLPRITSSGGRTAYPVKQLYLIEKHFDAYPEASEDDVPVSALRTEFMKCCKEWKLVDRYIEDPANNIQPTLKRRQFATGARPTQPHITKEEADRIRAAHEDVAVATEEHIGIPEIAKLANVSITAITGSLTQEERDSAVALRSAPKIRPAFFLDRRTGLAVVDRLARTRLPVDRVPMPMITARLDADRSRVWGFLKRHCQDDVTVLNLGIKNNSTSCISWRDMRALEKTLPLKKGVMPIDYDRILAQESSDEYARSILVQYIDENKVEAMGGGWHNAVEACAAVQCTPVALQYLAGSVKGDLGDVVTRTEDGLRFHDNIVDRMRRKPIGMPPIDWVSSQRLHHQLRQYTVDARAPVLRPASGHWMLGRPTKQDVTDVYYSLDFARHVLAQAKVQKRRAERGEAGR